MNTKELIAAEIAKVVPELEQENIQNLLETPKNADMGDLAFPAFSLAKVLRKAPQMIAADIAEKIDASNFEKLLVLTSTSSLINQKSQRMFLDKSSLKAATTLTKTSVTDVTSPLICLVLTSLNLSLSVTCVQQLSLTLLPTS